jgi:hypothetical protein
LHRGFSRWLICPARPARWSASASPSAGRDPGGPPSFGSGDSTVSRALAHRAPLGASRTDRRRD